MPPKKQQQKMSLFEFNANSDWADDMDETPLDGGYEPSHGGYGGSSYGNNASSGGYGGQSSYDRPKRDFVQAPVPDVPPFLAKLANLPYDISDDQVRDHFAPGYNIKEINLVLDRDTGKPRGIVNMEFDDKASLEKALTLDGSSFGGRAMKIFVSTPRDTRTERDWTRRGPLPPMEGQRDSDRDFQSWVRKPAPPPMGGAGEGEFDGPRETRFEREAREDSENHRDFSNWSRRGPLPSNDDRKTRGMEFRERRAPREPREPRDDPENPRDFSNWERRGPPKGEPVAERTERADRPPRPARKDRSPTRSDMVDSWRGDGSKPSGPGRTVKVGGGSLFGDAKPVDTEERLAAIEARKEKEREELLARMKESKRERDEKKEKEDKKDKEEKKEDKTERVWERRGPLPPKTRSDRADKSDNKKKDDKPKPKQTFAALADEGEESAKTAEPAQEATKENVDLPAAVEKLAIEDDGDWNVVAGKKRR